MFSRKTAFRRGFFRDILDLITAIGESVDRHNAHPTANIWTASASDILEKVNRAQASLNRQSAGRTPVAVAGLTHIQFSMNDSPSFVLNEIAGFVFRKN